LRASPSIQGFQMPKLKELGRRRSLKELIPQMQRLLFRPRQDKRDSMLPCHLQCIETKDL
jgi:hypothetical protein